MMLLLMYKIGYSFFPKLKKILLLLNSSEAKPLFLPGIINMLMLTYYILPIPIVY